MVTQAIKSFLSNENRWDSPFEDEFDHLDDPSNMALHFYVLQYVPPRYVEDVMAILSKQPEAANQVILLHNLVRQPFGNTLVVIRELIADSESSTGPELEQYIQIDADKETFEAIKQTIRVDWREATRRSTRLVVPVISRKVVRV